MMAALYDVSVPAINQHLKRIFGDNELEESSVVTDRTTACTTQNNEVEPQRTQRTQRNAPPFFAIFEFSVVKQCIPTQGLLSKSYLITAADGKNFQTNRIEIISPGHLPNNLTVEKIRTGNSNIRNPILVSYVAKGLLPYHGLGSGIKRALEEWPEIEFIDDHDGCLFQVTVTRKPVEELDLVDEDASKTTNAPINSDLSGQPDPINDLLNLIRETPNADYVSLAHSLQVSEASVKRYIQKLKQQNRLRRIGSKKTGHWEIIEHSSRISTN